MKTPSRNRESKQEGAEGTGDMRSKKPLNFNELSF